MGSPPLWHPIGAHLLNYDVVLYLLMTQELSRKYGNPIDTLFTVA